MASEESSGAGNLGWRILPDGTTEVWEISVRTGSNVGSTATFALCRVELEPRIDIDHLANTGELRYVQE